MDKDDKDNPKDRLIKLISKEFYFIYDVKNIPTADYSELAII